MGKCPVKIDFEGRTWSYDEDLITLEQAERIEDAGPWAWMVPAADGETESRSGSGNAVWDWRSAVNNSSAKAFRFLYWIMREQNGEPVPLDQVSFALPKFIVAYAEAWRHELEAAAAVQGKPDPTQPPATAPTPAGQPPEPAPGTSSQPPSSES